VREIKELLDACNIDYRDCLEKRELVKRLEEHRSVLPLHIKVPCRSDCHKAERQLT
jgi:hypothetical protein